ncbi:MAG: 16S rRNA (cytidine(1402)-2'-O)-methyltransferase [Cellvibrionales bacterium]|nr:16S rRNA (cytidine(1402)-2'-O)-methyltransferase [Porticoccaceae bacterium]
MHSDPRGTLYIVATPIGNLADMSPRAVEILQSVDIIACEDTRHSKKLLDHYHINSPTMTYHEHSDRQSIDKILTRLARRDSVALISDAGTPLISDPGYRLVAVARQQGVTVIPIPGSCALVSALSVCGLATDRFSFIGFLPAKSAARKAALQAWKTSSETLVCYEAPHRIVDTLADAMEVLGAEREAFVAREISKKFETYSRATLAELHTMVVADICQQRGEIVLIIAASPPASGIITGDAERILSLLKVELSPSKAASVTAKITGLDKRALYRHAMQGSSTANA